MTANQLTGKVHTYSLVAWQRCPETLMWPHSSRCCVHGQDQPLVQIIYKHDAAVFPLLHLTLVASNNVLLVVILSLLQTHQCFPTLISKSKCRSSVSVCWETGPGVSVQSSGSWSGAVPEKRVRTTALQCLRKMKLFTPLRIWHYPLRRHDSLRRESSSNIPQLYEWLTGLSQTEILQTWQMFAVMPSSAISSALNLLLWTTPFAASIPCPCLQECPTCHVSELLLSGHTMVFMLSLCCSPCSLAHKLDSITRRTQSTGLPLFLALSKKTTPAGHLSGLPVLIPVPLFPWTSH